MRAEMGRAGRKKILRRAAATGVLAALLLGLVAGVVLPARAKSAERATPAGASLEPAKPSEALCFPLGTTSFRVSDAYGWRADPFTGEEAFHRGVDLACAEGTPVRAALGGTVTAESFPEGTANFVSYINNAKSAGAGVIFAPVSINYAQLIVEAAAAQGFDGALLGSDTWDSNKVIESATGKDVEIYVTTFYQEGGAPDFDSGIKEWMNANPDALTNNGGNDMVAAVTAVGYDTYFTALEALKIAGSTEPSAVLEALPKVSFDGVTGKIEFDDIGDAKRDSAFIKTANTEAGTWDFVKVQTVG